MNSPDIIIAAKCLPQENILSDIKKAGLKAVELYISIDILSNLDKTIQICKSFPFRYSVHAPTLGHSPYKLSELAREINAEVVVMHNIYWEDEWSEIASIFKNINVKLCIENIYTILEPVKFMRRYRMNGCLDLEHLQKECAGVFEEEFVKIMREASHVHLTGYTFGSNLWHTPIHYSREHNLYLLNLLIKAQYHGMVVSEAKISHQSYEEFRKLNEFYQEWLDKVANHDGVNIQ